MPIVCAPAAARKNATHMISVERHIMGRTVTLGAGCTSINVLRDPRPDQLPHKGGRQGVLRLKADRPLARVIALELILVGGDRGRAHGIEGAMVLPCAK